MSGNNLAGVRETACLQTGNVEWFRRTWTYPTMTMQLSNYLFFTTTCEDALAFYAECGLGRVVEILRYGQNGMPLSGALL
jgi:hypothetical protein